MTCPEDKVLFTCRSERPQGLTIQFWLTQASVGFMDTAAASNLIASPSMLIIDIAVLVL